MDVQQLKMVQMVSQPIYSAICIYLSDVITLLIKINKLHKILFKISHRRKTTVLIIFGAVALLHTSYVMYTLFNGTIRKSFLGKSR